jgi:hypothetical protein
MTKPTVKVLIDRNILRRYFRKFEREMMQEYLDKIDLARSEEDYSKILQLRTEVGIIFNRIWFGLLNSTNQDLEEYLNRP